VPEKPTGGLAQLGERLHGMQEVIGSSPLSSTHSNSFCPASLYGERGKGILNLLQKQLALPAICRVSPSLVGDGHLNCRLTDTGESEALFTSSHSRLASSPTS